MAAAPAESTCSHSGIFTCAPARRLEFAQIPVKKVPRMKIAAASAGRGGRLIVAAIAALGSFPAMAPAQFFDLPLRPPADVPGATPGPAQNLAPPGGPAAPKG